MKIGLCPVRFNKMGGGQVGMVETGLVLHDAGHQVWLGGWTRPGPLKERLNRLPFPVCHGAREIRPEFRDTDILIAPAKQAGMLKDMRGAVRSVPCIIVAMWTCQFSLLRRWARSTGLPYHAIWVDSARAGAELSRVAAFPRKYRQLYSPIPLHMGRFEKQYDVTRVKAELGIQTRLVIGNVARHVGMKGIPWAIALWERCPEEAALLLIGSGRYHRAFKTQTREYKQVVFTGYVGDDTEYLAAMDVFVHLAATDLRMPHKGTVALAPCEAMLMGVPVITTKSEFGWSEQHKNGVTGYVVNELDEAIEKAALLLKDDALRERMSQSAQAFMLERNAQWKKNLLGFVDLIRREGP